MVDAVKVLAAKKEAVYGTDAAPTLADNAILTRNFRASPLITDPLERNLDRGSFGSTPILATNKRQELSYEVEVAGSGDPGVAPAWMELLEACGMAAAVLVPDTSATQQMAAANSAQSSLTHHHWMGDQRRKGVGSRGTFTMDFTAGAYPFIGLSYTCLIPAAAPRDVNVPGAATIDRWIDPLEVNTDNTLLELGGFSLIARSLTLNAGIGINLRNLIGSRYVNRGDHGITGRLVVEAPSMAAKDFLASLDDSSIEPLALTHGVEAGNTIGVSCAQTQITAISETEEDRKVMWEMDIRMNILAGQDDLVITAT
jgi:hypothetical protein